MGGFKGRENKTIKYIWIYVYTGNWCTKFAIQIKHTHAFI